MMNDEIDLVRLFQIIVKRKSLMLFFLILCLLAGFSYVYVTESIYEYATTLQVGTALSEGKDAINRSQIEGSTSVGLKLEKVYIPAAVLQLEKKYNTRIAKTKAKEQKNSDIVLITSKGSADDGLLLKELHQAVVAPLIVSHRNMITAPQKKYEILVQRSKLILKDLEDPKLFELKEKSYQRKIEAAQMELSRYDDQKELLLANKVGLAETRKLLDKQINFIEENLKFSYEKRNSAISEATDATKAMTFLVLNNDIQQSENRLAVLRERLHVTLESNKQEIFSELAANQRARKLQVTKVEEAKSQLIQLQTQRLSDQEQQKNTIASAENKINYYQNTKALNVAIRSSAPVGPGKPLILVLAGILGLMGGVILAFIAEFALKVRQQ